MEPNVFKQIVLAFVLWTGLPYFAVMIIFQVVALIITVIILVRLRAPDIAYKIVGLGVFFGLGLAVVATAGGWILFILECVTGILSLAISKGYTFTSPKVVAKSISRRGDIYVSAQAGQPYLGPRENAPQLGELGQSVGRVVEGLAGYDRELPSP